MAINTDCDVLIAGGGMVGISFALALDTAANGALRIVLAEGFAIPAASGHVTPSYRPSFDARSSALAHGSRVILEALGVWPTLAQHATPITTIHVSERDHFGSAELRAAERGWEALGYVVENAWLGNALVAELRRRSSIQLLNPATVTVCKPGLDCATATINLHGEEKILRSKLIAIADGADSKLRQQIGITTTKHAYGRDAIIANICCSEPHRGFAYERFTDWGPMALLPLDASDDGQPRMALVWTMVPERAQRLLDNSDGVFLNTLQQRFGNRQGQFTRVGQRFKYPLQLIRADEQVRRQIVVIGNAAHTLHPVAGQGFNLALRDVQRLADTVARAHHSFGSSGEKNSDNSPSRDVKIHDVEIGDVKVLSRYLESQQLDQWKTIVFSDRLTALFENSNAALGGLRRLGLLTLDLNPSLKNGFVDQTSGFHAGAALGHTSIRRPA